MRMKTSSYSARSISIASLISHPSFTPTAKLLMMRTHSASGLMPIASSSTVPLDRRIVARRARKYSRCSRRVASAGVESLRQSSVMRMRSARVHADAARGGRSASSLSSTAIDCVCRSVSASSVASASRPSIPAWRSPRSAVATARCAVMRLSAQRVSPIRPAASRSAKPASVSAAASCVEASRMLATSAFEMDVSASTSEAGVNSTSEA